MSELQVFAILCGIVLGTTIAPVLLLMLTTAVSEWHPHLREE